MSGLFDEDPTRVGVAAFGDAAPLLFGAAGVFGRDEAEEGHELFGMFEATEGANFAHGDHGGDELEAFEGHKGVDEGFALPIIEEVEHCFFEFGDALFL